ncbi:MAG: hypothetical protein R3297_08420 [Desulfobulbales bacterium]|nr:hypothetical protein [Desulfobulbales bacterium]
MNSTIADSIIIKVGHGIMTIPRNNIKKKEAVAYSTKSERAKEPEEHITQ